jgi:hypothetical protein
MQTISTVLIVVGLPFFLVGFWMYTLQFLRGEARRFITWHNTDSEQQARLVLICIGSLSFIFGLILAQMA